MEQYIKDFVSVVIPAYNCTRYIAMAIDSALGQQVPLEVIVVDDCSTDDLPGLMTRYRGEPRVRYVRNEKNQGVAQTRNRGVSLARGEYVAFLDADDYWAEGKLRLQLDRIREKKAVICSTARELMTPEGRLTGYVLPVKRTLPTGICSSRITSAAPPCLSGPPLPGSFPCTTTMPTRTTSCGWRFLKSIATAVPSTSPF